MPQSSLSIGFISLGCAKNLVDSQVMAGVLLSENLTLAPSPEEADVILVNTCAFIEDARSEAAEAILRACAHKAAGGCRAVIVAGCLPQRYRDRIAQTFPDVDAFLGVDELDRVGKIVRQVMAGKQQVMAVGAKPPTRLFHSKIQALRFSGGPFAYLKVAEGCNHACAFCAIPGIRGRFRSRSLPELVTEAQALLKSGVRELNLISQDTTSYGQDLRLQATHPDESTGGRRVVGAGTPILPSPHPAPSLPALLRALDALDGDFWLRILYGYPSLVTDELLETIATSRHICAYLDLPIQHSHPDMLRAMRRADTMRAVADLPQRLRQAVPNITLRTTCIVGFPGETEAHFQHLLEYVAQAKFDHLGVFAFSPEEGTPAFDMDDDPPAEVAAERCQLLMDLQRNVVDDRRRALIGTTAQVLVMGPVSRDDGPVKMEDGKVNREEPPTLQAALSCRLARQAPDVDGITQVRNPPADVKPGQFLDVRITGGHDYDLEAEVCQ